MRVLIITEGFNPEPHFKGLSFAKELQRLGHEVEVLTGFPNYPGGRVYPGYKVQLYQREIMEGVTVLRVPLYPSHDKSPIKRILTYVSFALSAAFFGLFRTQRPDVIYVYHPPATSAFPGMVLRFFHRRRVVYDIQDMWPDTLMATGMINSKKVLWVVGLWCRLTYRLMDRIVVLSQGFKTLLIARGVPENKIVVIRNWADESAELHYRRNEDLAQKLGLSGRFNILFAGTMGKAQALDAVLDAARLVEETTPEIQFVFIGGGIEKNRLTLLAESRNSKNIRFLDAVPIHEIGKTLALADVLLVHLKNDPLFKITIPSKIQGYLAAARPILIAVGGESGELIAKAGAGISCEPESSQGIAAAADKLFRMPRTELEQMGKKGRAYYDAHLSLKIGVSSFEKIFKELAQ